MISDDELHRLAVFLGSVSVLLIVLYHFLDVNTLDADRSSNAGPDKVLAAPGGIADKDLVSTVKEVKKGK